MATMAETGIGYAQQGIQQGGQDVSNAMDAYKFAQDTQAKRQQLEQQKQQLVTAKADTFLKSLDSVSRLPEGVQGYAIDNLRNQAPALGINPDFLDIMKKDQGVRRAAFQSASSAVSSGSIGPSEAGNMLTALGGDVSGAMKYALDKGEQVAKMKAAALAAAQRGAGLDSREKQSAERFYNNDSLVKTYTQRIDGASKILNLIDAAENSKDGIKSNGAILGQLNAEISRLETGSQSPGLAASEKTEMQDAAAKYHNILDTLSGGVTGVDLKAKFGQAKGMVKDLGQSYVSQMNDRADFLGSGGTDNQQSIFAAKRDSLNRIYGSRFKGAQAAPAAPSGKAATSAGVSLPADLMNQYKTKAQAAVQGGAKPADLIPFLQNKGLDQATITQILGGQ